MQKNKVFCYGVTVFWFYGIMVVGLAGGRPNQEHLNCLSGFSHALDTKPGHRNTRTFTLTDGRVTKPQHLKSYGPCAVLADI